MENASKALFIAGAIIVAIAIISISALIYYTVSDTIKDIDVDSTSISTHNSRFVGYIGEITGSQVKLCISNALANNNNEDTLPEYKVEVSVDSNPYVAYATGDTKKIGSGKQTICDSMSDNIKTNYLYDGSVTYSDKGIITQITFTRK